jgi:hypothetical protein
MAPAQTTLTVGYQKVGHLAPMTLITDDLTTSDFISIKALIMAEMRGPHGAH